MVRSIPVAAAAATALAWALAGCLGAEVGLSRQGKLGGTAASGGAGMLVAMTVDHDDGTQHVAAGYHYELHDLAPVGATVRTHALGARYARALPGLPAWRAFGRGSLGGGVAGAALGVERVWKVADEGPKARSRLAVGLAAVYTHVEDDLRGSGHFAGLELGVRFGVDLTVSVGRREAR